MIDTYDAIAAAQRLSLQVQAGKTINAVRLDSGDLVSLSQQVRQLLPDTLIFASGDLDEQEIVRLQAEGATIDGYGLGTKLVTGTPVNGVYKLVEIDGVPVMKGSSGKATYPGQKQIFRGAESRRLGLMSEMPQPGETGLLEQVMQEGQRLGEDESLGAIAQRTRNSVTALPASVRQVKDPDLVSVEISPLLQTLTTQTQAQIQKMISPP